MKTRRMTFNTYLLALLAATALDCKSPDASSPPSDKAATLRLYLEVNPDGTDRNGPVPIYRAHPVEVNVEKKPFLHEGSITHASIVDEQGSFAIAIQFSHEGAMVLENISTVSKGKHVAIFSQFGDARWLAAPIMSRQITDGLLVFTPDATREESERIVRGLNYVAAKLKNKK